MKINILKKNKRNWREVEERVVPSPGLSGL
jgi:hypothetical protein